MWAFTANLRRRYGHWWAPTWTPPVPVWVVGSLHVGGVGKTPWVREWVRQSLSENIRVGVLSRGYGRVTGSEPVWVSRGQGLLVSPEDGGDEPCFLARTFPEIPVLSCGDRRLGVELLAQTGVERVITDDGLQSLGWTPERALALLPSEPQTKDLRCLPWGTLREPLEGLKRATEVRVEQSSLKKWRELLLEAKIDVNVLPFERRCSGARHLGNWISTQELQERFVARTFDVVLSVARPDRVLKSVETLLGTPREVHLLGDHARIPESLVSRLNADVVTTEKDAVKSPWLQANGWILQEEIRS